MKVLYFSSVKEITGVPCEMISVDNLSQLFEFLKNKYPNLYLKNCLISLNCNLIPQNYKGVFDKDDELVFIPPVYDLIYFLVDS